MGRKQMQQNEGWVWVLKNKVVCQSVTQPIPSDYSSLNSTKNAACSSCWLFYSNFIPEAQCLPDLFPFLNYCRKGAKLPLSKPGYAKAV